MTYSTIPLLSEQPGLDEEGSSGWTHTQLGQVLKVIRGVTYKGAEARGSAAEGLLPVLRATNIGGELNFDGLVYVPESRVSEEQLLRVGDIVVAASSGSRSVVGKAALLKQEFTGSFGAFCFALRIKSDEVEPRFLAYYLQTSEYRNRVSALSAGVNINNLRRSHVETLPFSFPDLDDQRQIVDKIETHFARLDNAVAALQRARTRLKRYRASVLKAACEGRLVPTEAELARREGRDYEPASTLLDRIKVEREVNGKRGKNRKLAPLDTSNLPELPEGWAWTNLGYLSELVTSGSRGWARYYSDDGALFIRAQDINTDRLKLDSVAHVQLPRGAEGSRTRLNEKDILITITGANVTKSALVSVSVPEAYVSQHVGLVRLVYSCLAEYVYLWVVSPANGRQQLEKAAYGAGKPGLSLDDLRELTVALPPVTEMDLIVVEIERRLSVIDQLETTIGANLKRADALRQSILRRTFNGTMDFA